MRGREDAGGDDGDSTSGGPGGGGGGGGGTYLGRGDDCDEGGGGGIGGGAETAEANVTGAVDDGAGPEAGGGGSGSVRVPKVMSGSSTMMAPISTRVRTISVTLLSSNAPQSATSSFNERVPSIRDKTKPCSGDNLRLRTSIELTRMVPPTSPPEDQPLIYSDQPTWRTIDCVQSTTGRPYVVNSGLWEFRSERISDAETNRNQTDGLFSVAPSCV